MTTEHRFLTPAPVTRREALRWAWGAALAGMAWHGPLQAAMSAGSDAAGTEVSASAASRSMANAWAVAASNFHGIYDDPALRESFHDFLRHVFSIFPPDRFHGLITEVCRSQATDQAIYQVCQQRLGEVTPTANQLRNGLPALFAQTRTVGGQVRRLLEGRGPIDGYLEMGTKGGYIGYARSGLDLRGDLVLLGDEAASYALGDVFERRAVRKVGRFVALNDYAPIAAAQVAPGSLDVVCNPIGFHHIPTERRADFLNSLRQTLRKGGLLLVRDHDVDSPAMNQMVALAHDVFNMGLEHPWSQNQREVRHFVSLKVLTEDLARYGFRPDGVALYQAGDPTRNALMRFTAV